MEGGRDCSNNPRDHVIIICRENVQHYKEYAEQHGQKMTNEERWIYQGLQEWAVEC